MRVKILTFAQLIVLSAPAFCLELEEMQQKIQQCGQDYFNIYHAAPCEKEIGPDYYQCKLQGLDGFRPADSMAAKCIDEYAKGSSLQPWVSIVLKCQALKTAAQYLEKNPGDAVTKKFLDIMSMVKEPCNPLPTPEEAFKEDQRPKYTFKKPDNIVSPDDGAEIVWLISRGIGNDTIHLGISLSDKSFWRYVYGSNSGIKPASPEEEKQLLHFMKLWEIYGIEAEDLSVSNVAGCCHFKTARGGVARAFLYPNLLNPCSRNGPVGVTGHWMPTISQINKLEEALPTYLTTIGQNKLAATINQYDFLYLGIMVGQNTIIYIDALRKDPIKMVRRELAQDWQPKNKVGWIAGSCDGGDAAWGVEYDPKTSKFKHFAVNGG